MKIKRNVFSFFMFFLSIFGATQQLYSIEPASSTQTERPIPSIADLVSRAGNLKERFIDLETSLKEEELPTEVEGYFSSLEERIEILSDQFNQYAADKNTSIAELIQLRTDLKHERQQVRWRLRPLKENLGRIAELQQEWSEREAFWKHWQGVLQEESAAPTAVQVLERSLEIIEAAKKQIADTTELLLQTQVEGEKLQQGIYPLLGELDLLIKEKRSTFALGDSSLLLSPSYVAELWAALRKELFEGLQKVSFATTPTALRKPGLLFFELFSVVAFTALIIYFRPSHPKKGYHSFVEYPLSVAIILAVAIFSIGHTALQPIDRLLWVCIIWAALWNLLRVQIHDPLLRKLILSIAASYVLLAVVLFFHVPPSLLRLFIFFAAISVFALSFFALKNEKLADTLFAKVSLSMLLALSASVAAAELFGFSEVATVIFRFFVATATLLLLGWVLLLLFQGGMEWLEHSSPFRKSVLFSSKDVGFSDRLRFVLYLALGGYLSVMLMTSWEWFNSPWEAIESIRGITFSMGHLEFSLGRIIDAAILLYGAFFLSWVVQAFMVGEALPRMKVEEAVALSVARLFHYVIIAIGGILALLTLGFPLTDLTILGGAIGIGLGFGLQEMVKNFTGGLILLFERPVKIGDVIEFQGAAHRVKKIGLRSTVITSMDDADMIIPNSFLVVSPVTNWSLSSRKMRVRVPVSVAYGSDVEKAMEIIEGCATSHENVMNDPAPRVLFTNFGENGIEFELRAWIPNFRLRWQVRSELHKAIERVLREEGIVIPFPQRDVHLFTHEQGGER